jgi:hypothetical protein
VYKAKSPPLPPPTHTHPNNMKKPLSFFSLFICLVVAVLVTNTLVYAQENSHVAPRESSAPITTDNTDITDNTDHNIDAASELPEGLPEKVYELFRKERAKVVELERRLNNKNNKKQAYTPEEVRLHKEKKRRVNEEKRKNREALREASLKQAEQARQNLEKKAVEESQKRRKRQIRGNKVRLFNNSLSICIYIYLYIYIYIFMFVCTCVCNVWSLPTPFFLKLPNHITYI